MNQMQLFCVKAKTRAVHSLKAIGGGPLVGFFESWGIGYSFDLQPTFKLLIRRAV